MPVVSSILALAAVGLGAVGVGVQAYGAVQANKAQKASLAAQQDAQNIQRQSMELDAARRKRELIRQSVLARSQALSTATSQGAGQGSGLEGAYGQIAGQTDSNLLGVNQGVQSGEATFAANSRINAANADAADAGTISSIGGGLGSLGGGILKNFGAVSRVGQYVGAIA